jgi:hypothetical protein
MFIGIYREYTRCIWIFFGDYQKIISRSYGTQGDTAIFPPPDFVRVYFQLSLQDNPDLTYNTIAI